MINSFFPLYPHRPNLNRCDFKNVHSKDTESGIVRRFGTAVKGNIEFPSRHATHDKLREHLLKRSISDKIKFNDKRLGIVFEPFWHNDSVT